MSLYDTLGVKPDATPEEIKAAKRKKASEHHPDKGGDGEAMAKVNRAYEVLADPVRRAQYDQTGTEAPSKTPEDEARELLLKMMAEAIGHEAPNVIKAVHRMLSDQAAAAKDDTKFVPRRTQQLRKRRAKISVKKGENLAHGLIDAALAALDQRLKAAEHVLMVNKVARAILVDYEEPDDPPPQQEPRQGFAAFMNDNTLFDQSIAGAARRSPWR